MYIVILISLVAILFTYMETKGEMCNGMRNGFILVTILGAIHYDYGNDYMAYYDVYRSIANSSLSVFDIIKGDIGVYGEPGWHLLNYLFKYVGGFFVMVAVLNIIQNVIFYRFIKDNVEETWRPLAVFVYLCSTSLYLMNFSMMRQGLAAAIFLSLWPLIKERKIIPVIIILYLTSFIHSSAQFLIPFAFWGYIPFKRNKLISIILGLLFLTIWFSSDFITDVLNRMMALEAFEGYVDTYGDTKNTNTLGIGFVLHTLPFFVALYYLYTNAEEDIQKNSLCTLGIIGILLVPFCLVILMLGRFSVYFGVYSLAAIPICYSGFSNRLYRLVFVGLYVLIVFYDYLIFFSNPVWVKHFTDFHTIFGVI